MQSAYTIKVSEQQPNGVRHVSVLHHGEVHFSTSHKNMKWAFLTRFPAPSASYSGDLQHQTAFNSSEEKAEELGIGEGIKGRRNGNSRTRNDTSDENRVMHEYLCVFHRDEPKNRLSHYTTHQPWTICSAYSTINPASVTRVVLNNINPTDVVPGLRGVFVHGSLQSSRGVSPSLLRVCEHDFRQAADLWWMASHLTIRPVYVCTGNIGPAESFTLVDDAAFALPTWQQCSDEETGSVIPKYTLVGATVLAQFQAQNEQMAVTAYGSEVCLAKTIVVEHLDVMLWVWWPHRLVVPSLHVKGASVSLTVAECRQAPLQILFLFDATRSALHIIRTPNLCTGLGSMELLFTLCTNCPPIILPCLRPSMVQPIMVSNSPDANAVQLFYVPSLLRNPNPSSNMATMSLAGTLPMNLVLDDILYQDGSTVVFKVAPRTKSDSVRKSLSVDDVKEWAFSFPSLMDEQHPLVHFVLEALESVLETELVAMLQCELIRRAWKSKCKGEFWDFGRGLIVLVADIVLISMNPRTDADPPGDGPSVLPGLGDQFDKKRSHLCDIVVDPLTLTADVLQSKTLDVCSSPSITKFAEDQHDIEEIQAWTEQQCGLSVFVLHLLYESLKLQERFWNLLESLARLNLQLSQIMGWSQYIRYYSTSLCIPEKDDLRKNNTNECSVQLCAGTFRSALPEHLLRQRFAFHAGSSAIATLSGAPPMLYTILQRAVEGKARASGGWPAVRGISETSPISVANKLFFLLTDCFDAPKPIEDISANWWYVLCRGLLQYGIDPKFVSSELCVGVAQLIERALCIAKDNPDSSWGDDFNIIIGRFDRLRHTHSVASYANPADNVVRVALERAIGREYRATLNDDDGVIMRPDFPKHWSDSRMDIVQTMLNTATPITLPSQVDGTDAHYTSLINLIKRTTALPTGRGMFTLCTQNFRVRDSVPIPRLCLEGRTDDGITITNVEEIPVTHLIWPLFHNGCAAGLRFLPLPHARGSNLGKEEESITRHWVLYQTRNIACPAARSGLLLAAGLLGHLKVLQRTDIYSLLVSPQSQFSGRETVTIAVMLGLSCSLRGTCNTIVFNCISMHVQSLTPATEDIEVSLDVQTAALVSIGLLYQRSPDAFLVEMLLIQMSRLPSDEHFRDREGYALGAGFGLGLMLLGIGGSHGVPHVENRLLKFMEGARREAAPSMCEALDNFNELNPDSGHFLRRTQMARNAKESFRYHSTRVFEGDCFNTAVSGPAALVALGLMYLQTEDASMAAKIAPPERLEGLQGVFPGMCLLRSMMSSLVVWTSIEPTRDWLRRNVPSCLLKLAECPEKSCLAPAQVQYLMINLGHCLAGSVLALGIRFAGSMDAEAKTTVLAELSGFLRSRIGTAEVGITAIQNSTGAFHACISACAVALALIMAGTGDAQSLAMLQKLYKRTNVKYGDHFAVSMATGLLFLGGGQLTLSNSIQSVAALIIAFYPIWPETSTDNKMHLQALRHLYCLAVVPRLIETVDVLTNQPVSVPIRVIVHRGRLSQNEPSSVVKEMWTPLPEGKENQAVRMVTPCLLPGVDTVSQIEVRSAQHYSIMLHKDESNAITDSGVVVRVLEKNVCGANDGQSRRSLGEELVVSWIYRLFHEQLQQRPGPIEATVILDNLNFLFISQERFSTEFSATEKEFSLDFVMNVRQTLEKRYRGLMQRSGRLSQHHPLSKIVMAQKSVYSAAASLAETLTNNCVTSPDIAPVLESILFYTASTEAVELAEKSGITVIVIMRWLSQALYFHGLAGNTGYLSSELERHAGGLRRRGQRFYTLYIMNHKLLLRPKVLEDLVDCCVEYEEQHSG
ncbi:putative cyclosome subunit 1 [Trypanosoma vivax]|nr:putative cyclosome subunit 1 [Trypanosoma vivax]